MVAVHKAVSTNLIPIQPKVQTPTHSTTKEEKIFDRYVVHNPKELRALQDKRLLRGAFVITRDTRHVGHIHRIFLVAQVILKIFEKIRAFFLNVPERKIDINLCHGMVAISWDYDSKYKKYCEGHIYGRPCLAHVVTRGVAFNKTDYFTYQDKDVTELVVYVPKDETLREEFARNAEETAKRSGNKDTPESSSKFSWGNLLTCIFKNQFPEKPSKAMQKNLAYTVTDILLERKLSDGSKEKKTRSFYCMEYAVEVLQASILTNALTSKEKEDLKNLSREELASQIYQRIRSGDTQDALAKAYWESRVCTKINPSGIVSAYAGYHFDHLSEDKKVENL